MNKNFCADRLLIGDEIIAITSIVRCKYNSQKRQLILWLIDRTELDLRGELAESTWDYLRATIYGCVEPLPLWQQNVRRAEFK